MSVVVTAAGAAFNRWWTKRETDRVRRQAILESSVVELNRNLKELAEGISKVEWRDWKGLRATIASILDLYWPLLPEDDFLQERIAALETYTRWAADLADEDDGQAAHHFVLACNAARSGLHRSLGLAGFSEPCIFPTGEELNVALDQWREGEPAHALNKIIGDRGRQRRKTNRGTKRG